MINYCDNLTEEQESMLTVLRNIYPRLPMHFYCYSFTICPNKYITGFSNFFNDWWGYHGTYFPVGDKSTRFFEMIDKKYLDYIKAMDIKEFEHIEKSIIEGKSDAEVDEIIHQFWMSCLDDKEAK